MPIPQLPSDTPQMPIVVPHRIAHRVIRRIAHTIAHTIAHRIAQMIAHRIAHRIAHGLLTVLPPVLKKIYPHRCAQYSLILDRIALNVVHRRIRTLWVLDTQGVVLGE